MLLEWPIDALAVASTWAPPTGNNKNQKIVLVFCPHVLWLHFYLDFLEFLKQKKEPVMTEQLE